MTDEKYDPPLHDMTLRDLAALFAMHALICNGDYSAATATSLSANVADSFLAQKREREQQDAA